MELSMDNWIESSSSLFRRKNDFDTILSLESLNLSDDSDLEEDEEQTTHRKIRNSYNAIFEEINPNTMQCKHFDNSKKLYTPRTFQHHQCTKLMSTNYQLQGYEVKKNYRCPQSACYHIVDEVKEEEKNLQDKEQNANEKDEEGKNESEEVEDFVEPLSYPSEHAPNTDYLRNLLTYRYMRVRKRDNKKQVMCRLCAGVNWIETRNYFKHMFLAHGLISRFNDTTKWYRQKRKNNTIIKEKIETYFTIFIESIKSPDIKFCRDILPLIQIDSIPLPIRYYSDLRSSGFRRTHVMCPSCKRYIRIGWCEHDEIIKRQYEDFESLNIATFKDYSRLSYVQTRKRGDIEGIYENYFVHYVECNFSNYDSTCLYVIINN